MNNDLISRQQAIAMCRKPCMRNADCSDFEMEIMMLPSAQPYTINPDGRLWITVDDIDKVTAVVVDEHKSKFCKQFYEDYEDAQPEIIRCKDCKHWIPYDWMFSEVWQSQNIDDYPEDEIGCNLCDAHMKANDFCSRAERRTDGRHDRQAGGGRGDQITTDHT